MKSIVLLFTFLTLLSCKEEAKKDLTSIKNTSLSGPIFGTTYNIIYDSEVNYSSQIDSLFQVINQSMSTYITDSDISRLNRQDTVAIDSHFKTVLQASNAIYKATNGVFDPTIGAVVNAWDFGPEGKLVRIDSTKIKDLMKGVGFNKINIDTSHLIIPEGTFIDFNAIAKGYAVDVVSNFLTRKNHRNHLVEIGGEIRASGMNMEKKLPWRVGLDQPRFDGQQSIMKAISIEDIAMATSGTYRKFKIDEQGNRYAHIIDTKTGYPSKTNILSVSVMATDCMTADAFATAFQAMGIDGIKDFLRQHPELKVFLVFENEQQELETLNLNSFPTD